MAGEHLLCARTIISAHLYVRASTALATAALADGVENGMVGIKGVAAMAPSDLRSDRLFIAEI